MKAKVKRIHYYKNSLVIHIFQSNIKMLYLLALLAIMPSAMAGPGKISSSQIDIRKLKQIVNWVINLFKIIFHKHDNSYWIKLISYLI